MIVKCIQLHYTRLLPKQKIRHKLEKLNSTEATTDIQQKDKKLGQKDNQLSGTGLLQTGPMFPLLIVVVRNIFVEIKIFFLIN